MRSFIERNMSEARESFGSDGLPEEETLAGSNTLASDDADGNLSGDFRSCDDSGMLQHLDDTEEPEDETRPGVKVDASLTEETDSNEDDSQHSDEAEDEGRPGAEDADPDDDDSPDCRTFKTSRGKLMLYLDGYFYVLDKEVSRHFS